MAPTSDRFIAEIHGNAHHATAPTKVNNLSDCYPVLLLPVRLETRFLGDDLWVRIYPDQISLDTHNPELTQAEFSAGRRYQDLAHQESEDKKRNAWSELARRFGPERAAWIAKATTGENRANQPMAINESGGCAPCLKGMPDHFVAFVYREGVRERSVAGSQVRHGLAVLPAPNPVTYGELGQELPSTLVGQVNDSQSQPISDLRVTIEGTNLHATTGPLGAFRFEGLTGSRVSLRLDLPGCEDLAIPVTVGSRLVTIVAHLAFLRSRWMVDLWQAQADGMAICIPLTEDELELKRAHQLAFSRIIVVGMPATDPTDGQHLLEEMIESHRHSTGFGFLEYGTPTNNTQTARSGHSETTEDIEGSYETENQDPAAFEDPRTNAHRLGNALGLLHSEALHHVEHGTDRADSYAEEMQRALWNSTGDYLLRTLLSDVVGKGDSRLGQHFASYVRGSGPLPAIRIGDQPYGILPVTKIRQAPRPDPADFDTQLHSALIKLFDKWLAWAQDYRCVPRVGSPDDPDKELLQILAMEPLSVSYRTRPFINQPFVDQLMATARDSVFKPGSDYAKANVTPLYWVQVWAEAWQIIQQKAAELLHSLTGAPLEEFKQAQLLGLYGWWDDRDVEEDLKMALVHGAADDPIDSPGQYLWDLWEKGSSESKTLLCDLLQRSLAPNSASCFTKDEVHKVIRDLATSTILEFFNSVREPGQITVRIPSISESRAQEILAHGCFTSIDQIGAIVGPCIFLNILDAFRGEEPTPDIERMFRETLDLCTHRLDAWITSLATKRLLVLREDNPQGIYMGSYGWVEDLHYTESLPSEGYIHAPSWGQAVAAAVLHNAFLTHSHASKANPYRINLNSERVRRALHVLEGVRQGQPLGALLGYQFERALHERKLDRYIDNFRAAFPIVANKETSPTEGESVDAIAARNVVDGLTLARWWEDRTRADIRRPEQDAEQNVIDLLAQNGDLQTEAKNLLESFDAISDVLMYEAVYQSLQGRFERGGAALEAAAGNARPPEIESVATPVTGRLVGHRVCLLFPEPSTAPPQQQSNTFAARAAAEPRLAAWFGNLLGDLEQIGCWYSYPETDKAGQETTDGGHLSLQDLGVSAIDVLYLSAAPPAGAEMEIEQRIKYWVRQQDPALKYDTPIQIDVSRPDGFPYTYSVGEALELGQQVLNTLGAGVVLDPGALRVPAEAETVAHTPEDVQELDERFRTILIHICELVTALGGQPILDLEGSPLCYAPKSDKPLSYTVQPGDTLEGLAWRFGTTVEALTDINDLQPADQLIVGQVLLIPDILVYQVTVIDTLWDLALRFETTIWELVRINKLKDPNSIVVGQVLWIPTWPQKRPKIISALFGASQYGISGAIPAGIDDPELRTRGVRVLAELQARALKCQELRTQAQALGENQDQQIEFLIEAMKALFGGGLVVLPTFASPLMDASIRDHMQRGDTLDLLAGLGEKRVRLWLQQLAEVHPPLHQLEAAFTLAQAWREAPANDSMPILDRAPALSLHVIQLPFDAANRWVGLDDEERGPDYDVARDRGALSIVAALGAPADDTLLIPGPQTGPVPRLAGLLLDQWDEQVPSEIVQTSLSFQYDGPSSQAQQCLLLAVPSPGSVSSSEWKEEELADIIKDTMDLAKARAVDFDAICATATRELDGQALSLLSPTLVVSTDPEHLDWAQKTVDEIIQEFHDARLPLTIRCANFADVVEPIGERVEIGTGPDVVSVYDLGQGACLVEVVLNSSQSMRFLYHGITDPGILEFFMIDLPAESPLVRLDFVWAETLFNSLTDEEIVHLQPIRVEAYNGDGQRTTIEVAYERREQVQVVHPDLGTIEVPLFEVEIRGVRIRTLRLEPKWETFLAATLLGRVCYGVPGET